MPMSKVIQDGIDDYLKVLPDPGWYERKKFYSFVEPEVRKSLIDVFKGARVSYKLFEGIQASGELLKMESRTQVLEYASVFELGIDFFLKNYLNSTPEYKRMISGVKISHPLSIGPTLERQIKEHFNGMFSSKDKVIVQKSSIKENIPWQKIRFDKKMSVLNKNRVFPNYFAKKVQKIYSARNMIHIDAEIKKKNELEFDLQLAEEAERVCEGVSIYINDYIDNNYFLNQQIKSIKS